MGDSRSSPGKGVSTGSPSAAASRPATVVAALTLTCCPSTTRTAASKASKAPFTRSPGLRRTEGASTRWRPSAAATAAGSASRSKSARSRAASGRRRVASDGENDTRSPGRAGSAVTETQPRRLAEPDRPAVGAALDLLHAGGAATGEELEHRLPVERWPVGEAEDHPPFGAPPSTRAAASGSSSFSSSSWIRQSGSWLSFDGSTVPKEMRVKEMAQPDGCPGLPVTW